MITDIVRDLILRELRAFRREIEAYANERDLWALPPGISNSGGTLALHLAGNLQHYVGARLGGTDYVRHRDLEFSRREVDRAELLHGLDAAAAAVERTFDRLTDAPSTGEWLIHLAVHLGYHLGQVDYHRRMVTGDARTVDAVSVRELPSAKAG